MSRPPTLLLADDSVTIQRVVALSFANERIRVVVARDGQDAINRMATETPDLVLADTNMPCVDGYELTRWMRLQSRLRTVPVLLLAGATDPVDEQRLHDSGANGVLEKPFEPSHVISRVKALLGMTGTPQTPQTRLVTASVAASVRGEPAVSAAGAARASMATTELPTRGHGDLWRSEEPAPTGMPNVIEESSGMAPIDDVIDAFETRSQEPSAVASVAPATADARSPEHLATSHANRVGGAGAPAVVTAARPAPPTADVFETLLAAEQGDPLALDARLGSFDVPAAAPEMTDETLEALAERVSRKLHEPLSAGLRDIVVRTVQDGMATEARAAVAEAVQAAVDGTILGTLRGSVNEAVAAAVPAAVEQQVTGVLRESAERALSGAVGQAVRDTVAAQAAGMVRETVEREMRDGVAPLVQQLVREVVGDTLRQVVTNALAASVPAAMAEAVRSEAAGHIREVVHETSERLVREEIARIRERHG